MLTRGQEIELFTCGGLFVGAWVFGEGLARCAKFQLSHNTKGDAL